MSISVKVKTKKPIESMKSLSLSIMKNYLFTAQIEKDKETGFYVGIVPNLPGAHTQAETLDELRNNLEEVIQLCLEELSEEERSHLSDFVGFQQISVAV